MPNVAIVDDELSAMRAVRAALEDEGCRVEIYSGPLIALPKLILVPPSVLLLNGRMPGLHGIDVFFKFREFSQAPVIFVSASATEIEAQLQALGRPASASIDKPFAPRTVVAGVKRVLHQR